MKNAKMIGLVPRASVALWTAVVVAFSIGRVEAFSLLGPYADWMQPQIGYHQAGDIGGPMALEEEYRWNVPVLTYGFDQSFLDYFGSNGVAAVEGAFQILNDLPAASEMELTNFPLRSLMVNYRAQSQGAYDLKSATLAMILEEMGLTEAMRHVFDLRRWDLAGFEITNGVYGLDELFWPPSVMGELVLMRNFDPDTLAASTSINGKLFSGYVQILGTTMIQPEFADVVEILINGHSPVPAEIPVAGVFPPGTDTPGWYFLGLTRDDAGGLKYLLNTNNVNLEPLLSDVHGIGSNADTCVNLALRPGVEKITFLRQEYDSLLGRSVPIQYQYTDTYFTNGVAVHQQLERVVAQPDFLFSVAEFQSGGYYEYPEIRRAGTGGWWNSARPQGNGSLGPGIISSPVRITFNKPGVLAETPGIYSKPGKMQALVLDYHWASFAGSPTNAPLIFPEKPEVTNFLRLPFRLISVSYSSRTLATFVWQVPVASGGLVSLEVSTNLMDWTSCAVLTNTGVPAEWVHDGMLEAQRFFRAIPVGAATQSGLKAD